MTLDIQRASADSEIFYFAKDIILNGKKYKTPLPTFHPTVNLGTNPSLYEIWKKFDFQKNNIADIQTDNKVAINIAQSIQSAIPRPIRACPRVVFVELRNFDGNPVSQCSEGLRSFFLDQVRLQSEVMTFPVLSDLAKYQVNANLMENYTQFLQNCHEIAETLNTKPIMGIIPPVPRHSGG